MFDISFIELLVIFVVALLVLGPDKLPGAIRTAALWIGRAKRSLSQVKSEIEQQINADDIRRQLHNESILADIEKARKSADNVIKETQKELEKTRSDINQAISTDSAPASTPVVTSSAEEGLPTGTESWPAKDNHSAPAANTEHRTEPRADVQPEVQSEAPAPIAPEMQPSAPTQTPSDTSAASSDSKPPAAQDIYNTPPTGRVTITGRKLSAMPLDEAVPDSSAKKD